MKATQITIPEPASYRRARRNRAKTARIKMLKRYYESFTELIDEFPERAYKETTSILSKTIVLLLLVGTTLMSLGFAFTALLWFCEFIPM